MLILLIAISPRLAMWLISCVNLLCCLPVGDHDDGKVDIGDKVDIRDPIGVNVGFVDGIGMKVCGVAFATTCFFSDLSWRKD